MVDAIGAAMPLLLQARVLAATARAQRTHGRPVTSAEILHSFDVPLARSTKGLTVLLAKVATLPPDESGRRLLDLGKDRTGTRTFLVDAPSDSSRTPEHAPPPPASAPAPPVPARATLAVPPELATRLERLAGGELGATPADVLATVLSTALDAVESTRPAAAPRAREPGAAAPVSERQPDPIRHETGPGSQPPQDSPLARIRPSDSESPPAPASELAAASDLEKLFAL